MHCTLQFVHIFCAVGVYTVTETEVRRMTRQKWLVSGATVLLGGVTLLVYTLTGGHAPTVYAQVAFTSPLPMAMFWLFRRRVSFAAGVAVAAFILLASFLGSALQFYRLISWWDLLMHGLFGVVGCVVVSAVLSARGITLGLAVMGCAALWEIFEFIADALLGGDAQRVAEAMKLGTSPIADTMTDMMITMVGIAAFYIGIYSARKLRK